MQKVLCKECSASYGGGRAGRAVDRRPRPPGPARAGPPAAQRPARPAAQRGPVDGLEAGSAARREQRQHELPPPPAGGARLRRGGTRAGHRPRALVAGPAPQHPVADRRRRRAARRARGGRGVHPPVAVHPAPDAGRARRAAGAPRPGVARRDVAQRLGAAPVPHRGARACRGAQRGAAAVAGRPRGPGTAPGERARRRLPALRAPGVTRAPLTPRQAQRRYVGLTALRWLPIGIAAPVTVLLATSRGLSPADIGATVAVYGAVTLLLELPTGGLADAIGHRPVLVLSGLLGTASLLLMTVADGVGLFALAWALLGVGRALDSGPLEAWYVDTVHARLEERRVGEE